MKMNKTRIAVFAVLFVAVGMLGGLIVSLTLTSGRAATADFNGQLNQYLTALDQRIATLPPMDQSFTLVAKRVTPAVVTISSERVVRTSGNMPNVPEEFRRFFGNDDFFFRGQPQEQRQQGLGSGVIVDPNGIILTNNHVVEQADSIQVTFADRRTVDAKVVGSDPLSDIAVLRVDAKNLPYVELGDSDTIEVGQWVLAIGNPFSADLAHTVTAGIISAKGRAQVELGTTFQDFIQTDAAINPGNSGGALVNMKGELIGINSAIATNTGTFSGIGFAVPSNLAKKIMESLLKHGKVIRGYLGLYPQDLDVNLARSMGMDRPTGAIVSEVIKGSPADKAGVRNGDIILTINGAEVSGARDLTNKVGLSAPGTVLDLGIMRDNSRSDLKVALGERAEDTQKAANDATGDTRGSQSGKLGLQLIPLTSDRVGQLAQVYRDEKGLVIANVDPGSPADKAGLAPQVLITSVNGTPVSTIAEFEAAIATVKPGGYARIYAKVTDGQGTVVGRYFAIEIPRK